MVYSSSHPFVPRAPSHTHAHTPCEPATSAFDSPRRLIAAAPLGQVGKSGWPCTAVISRFVGISCKRMPKNVFRMLTTSSKSALRGAATWILAASTGAHHLHSLKCRTCSWFVSAFNGDCMRLYHWNDWRPKHQKCIAIVIWGLAFPMYKFLRVVSSTRSLSMGTCGGSMCDFCICDMFSNLREITNVKRSQQLAVNCTRKTEWWWSRQRGFGISWRSSVCEETTTKIKYK